MRWSWMRRLCATRGCRRTIFACLATCARSFAGFCPRCHTCGPHTPSPSWLCTFSRLLVAALCSAVQKRLAVLLCVLTCVWLPCAPGGSFCWQVGGGAGDLLVVCVSVHPATRRLPAGLPYVLLQSKLGPHGSPHSLLEEWCVRATVWERRATQRLVDWFAAGVHVCGCAFVCMCCEAC